MRARRACLGGLALALVLTGWPAFGQVISRPEPGRLSAIITGRRGFLAAEDRARLAVELQRLDEIHLAFVRRAQVLVAETAEPEAFLRAATMGWPSALRAPERAILGTLILQVQMLDAALARKDPAKADDLRAQLRKRKLLSDRQRIYGDDRDIYYAELLARMSEISRLQGALGVEGVLDVTFPVGLRPPDAVPFVEKAILALTQRARSLAGTV
ncbi:MAG: hypothetical protein PHI34_05970 [Acidobacteriota bacterium]|nr:hypothetical protein [Acidobacteriota bacterium]